MSINSETPTPSSRFSASNTGACSTPKPLPRKRLTSVNDRPTPTPRSSTANRSVDAIFDTPSPVPRQTFSTPTPLPRQKYFTPTPPPRQKSVMIVNQSDSVTENQSVTLLQPSQGAEDEELGVVDLNDPITLQSLKDLDGFLNECEKENNVEMESSVLNDENVNNERDDMRFVVYEDEANNSSEQENEHDIQSHAEQEANQRDIQVNEEHETVVQTLQEKPKLTRKRAKKPSKQAKAKAALDKGLEHVNVGGKKISARVMKEPCKQCRFKCSQKVSENERRSIFSGFWGLADHTRQLDNIKDHILITDPTVHLTEDRQRQNTIKYFFVVDGKITYVCKNMFLNTFCISESWVRTVLQKLKSQELGHTIPQDMRGRHNKIPPAVLKRNEENVIEHINLFKPVPSHFCRAKSTRVYLDNCLNIKKMWRLYKEWMAKEKAGEQIKSEKYYRRIFNTKFNIVFHQPKKDLCDFCTVYTLSSNAQKAAMQAKYDLHLQHKANAKRARKEDEKYALENKTTVCYAIFDLQKVLSVPKLDTGMVYYKRKLSMYNFTIYNVIEHKGYCYTWNESEAFRGANEIATCVLQFISLMIPRTPGSCPCTRPSPTAALWTVRFRNRNVPKTEKFWIESDAGVGLDWSEATPGSRPEITFGLFRKRAFCIPFPLPAPSLGSHGCTSYRYSNVEIDKALIIKT
ncbi:Otogelin [Frankliniella fusca]|uniref:Otogelin n=1 Tax=Frankliniella fusca TaxID=407009 RepID=A0AAE1H3L5_9NEOP|nr:Otogelin [Frankliniella fusca]